jgi:hypothetical protein
MKAIMPTKAKMDYQVLYNCWCWIIMVMDHEPDAQGELAGIPPVKILSWGANDNKNSSDAKIIYSDGVIRTLQTDRTLRNVLFIWISTKARRATGRLRSHLLITMAKSSQDWDRGKVE